MSKFINEKAIFVGTGCNDLLEGELIVVPFGQDRIKNPKRLSLEWLVKNIKYRFRYPDEYSGWKNQIIKKIDKELKEDDVLISSSGSMVAHMAALVMKKKKPTLTWIADFGDPWYEVDKKIRPWFSPLSKYLENKVIKESNAVVVTTPSTKRKLESLHGFSDAIHVVPYGYSQFVYKKNVFDGSELSVGHIGASHIANRDLRPFLSALADLSIPVNITLAGSRSQVYDELATAQQLAGRWRFSGYDYVDYFSSLELLSNMDFIPIVGNIDDTQTPGKVFVCLASNIPILYLQQVTSDRVADFISKYPGVIVCNNDKNEIAKSVNYIVNNYSYLYQEAKKREDCSEIDEFSRVSTTKKLMKIIESA